MTFIFFVASFMLGACFVGWMVGKQLKQGRHIYMKDGKVIIEPLPTGEIKETDAPTR